MTAPARRGHGVVVEFGLRETTFDSPELLSRKHRSFEQGRLQVRCLCGQRFKSRDAAAEHVANLQGVDVTIVRVSSDG